MKVKNKGIFPVTHELELLTVKVLTWNSENKAGNITQMVIFGQAVRP